MADREHTFLLKIIQPQSTPSVNLSLATVDAYLEQEFARIAQQQGPAMGFLFLCKCYRRSADGSVPSGWQGVAQFQEVVQTVALTNIMSVETADKVRALVTVLESDGPPKLINGLLVAVAEEGDVPSLLLQEIAKPLKGQTLNSQALTGHLGRLLMVLKASKKYPVALTTSPCLETIWRPVFTPKLVTHRTSKGEPKDHQRPGSMLQHETVLGWVLSPTCVDTACVGPSQAHLTEGGSSGWANLLRSTRPHIEGLQRTARMKVTGIRETVKDLVTTLIRGGDVPRFRVLEWLGVMLAAAELRGKQGHIAPEGFNFWPHGGHHIIDVLQNDRAPPFNRKFPNMLLLQALHARLYGFPTSGCAINAFSLLLSLAEPIKSDFKADGFNKIFPYFTLRPDVPDFLGSWQTEDRFGPAAEARFGENDQVATAMEIAKRDPRFAVSADDNTLFQTEVFWLTTKGIGTLLLPVAKETFNTFNAIAGVFYQKDQENWNTGWREFLLGEALLKEPGFLAELGKFIDLTFRFLQYTAAAEKDPFPLKEPGAAWHALPSTMIENIIDVCDLYRPREGGRGTGIPDGLFANLQPMPMLTTLCMIAASDSLVKDPSLRGRAVKLVYKLCWQFTSWQPLLNDAVMLKEFVPCLVGAFVGVEKAIMSYYDLAHRYKYDLRIPIIEMFDHVLQREEHRATLVAHARNEGNDMFLKMLTLLINDINSQTEEAIRTLKDWHEHQKTGEAGGGAAGPGGRHDEEILDDDNTEGGEDVYRRSRMNYKEHSKKYFTFANRSWKLLKLMTQYCPDVIINGRTVLEQLTHSSLNSQLHWLVGPEMKNIKATPQEYNDVNFNPKESVKLVAEMYLALVRTNVEEVSRVVAKDGRFYSDATFGKAFRFARKYNLLSGKDLDEFDKFVKHMAASVSEQRAAVEEADIPDEFLCEMMAEIMSDPVMFPQSKCILDRSTAERAILGSDRDPYSNTPVKVADLLPQTELKEKIHKFAKEKGIHLEGGNMFD